MANAITGLRATIKINGQEIAYANQVRYEVYGIRPLMIAKPVNDNDFYHNLRSALWALGIKGNPRDAQ